MGSTSGKILDEEAGSPYLRIRDAIIEGQFPPNTALVEQNLAEWCGVSRTPIREALRRLEQLIQEAVITVPRALIAETINLVAVLAGRGADRRLAELALVTGLGSAGDYSLSPAGD